jgi:hypothetical protein
MLNQATLWSKNVGKLDKSVDRAYIVNQVLMFGTLDEINKLKTEYGDDEVKRIFIENPINIYSKSAFNFIKNFVLKIKEDLNGGRYIKSVY